MDNLPRIKSIKKRLGRGYGSGKGGHTVGRGQKGQKTRNKLGVLFEGVKMKKSFVKRLPFLRGKNKFKSHAKPLVLNLKDLIILPKDVKKVNVETLASSGIVDLKRAKVSGVKILGKGEITSKLIFELPVSRSAKEKITRAGGEIISSPGR